MASYHSKHIGRCFSSVTNCKGPHHGCLSWPGGQGTAVTTFNPLATHTYVWGRQEFPSSFCQAVAGVTGVPFDKSVPFFIGICKTRYDSQTRNTQGIIDVQEEIWPTNVNFLGCKLNTLCISLLFTQCWGKLCPDSLTYAKVFNHLYTAELCICHDSSTIIIDDYE